MRKGYKTKTLTHSPKCVLIFMSPAQVLGPMATGLSLIHSPNDSI